MVDWEAVRTDLAAAGYPGFELQRGRTAVPGVSGEWVVGTVERTGPLERSKLPFPYDLLRFLPGTTLPTDPTYAPPGIRSVAESHGLDVVIVSGDRESVRLVLCDPASR